MLFLLLASAVQGYNLAVDVNPKAVTSYLESFGSFYRQQLTDYEIPVIEKNRCLGKIAIASTTVSQVEIDRTEAIREKGDYYLKLTHLHARLHGDYKHNVLFVHQSGDFDLRIRDLNATLGPLVPVAIAGLPYIDSSVGCRISHSEDNFDVHGGILRVIAKRRLRETLETDLEALLCDSLIEILDKGIRISLEHVQLKSRLHDEELISFAFSRPPLMLDSGAVRVFHEGVSSHSQNKNFRFDVETVENLNFDVVFHIHQNLLTEALTSVCKIFERTVQNVTVKCLSVSANFSELGKSDNVVLTTILEENDTQKTRFYNSRLLHSEKLVLYMRLKSERLAPGTKGEEFSRALFTTFSETLRSKFQLTLPLPKNLRMESLQAVFGEDRLVLVGNLK